MQFSHAIVMMASLFVTTQMIDKQPDVPLLSFRDVRIMMVIEICNMQIEMEDKMSQMQKRHKKRQADIDFAYKKQRKKLKS